MGIRGSTLASILLEMKPAFILLYLSSMGFLCILAAQKYMGVKVEPVNCLSFMGIIFGVYTLNRFTDTAEDFTNDLGRLLFFQRQKAFLYLACASLAASLGFLAFKDKLNWMHFLLLGMGFAYSYRLVPWYARGTGFRLLRIKEMTFLKNLAVSFLWGASVFIVPILYSAPVLNHRGMIWLLACALFLSTLNNTLFDDILDEAGDRVAGIKTLPTVWGAGKSQLMLMALDVLWLLGVTGLYLAGNIDQSHAAFLAFMALYPFVYMSLNAQGALSKGWVDFLSETDLLLFSVGLLLLSLR